MRQTVFRIYVGIAIVVGLGALVIYLTVVIRMAPFEGAAWLIRTGVPEAMSRVYADPWLLPAFFVAASLFWSIPWGKLVSAFNNNISRKDDFRRGRPLLSSDEANLNAYKNLLRRRSGGRSKPSTRDSSGRRRTPRGRRNRS